MIESIIIILIFFFPLGLTIWLLSKNRKYKKENKVLLGAEQRSQTLGEQLSEATKRGNDYENQITKLNDALQKYQPLLDKDEEITAREARINSLKEAFEELNNRYQLAVNVHGELEKQINLYKDDLEVAEYGLYESKYSFGLPEQYRLELEANYQKQKGLIDREQAVVCSTEWNVGGSVAEGKKMTQRYIKLMLFAFNGECDAIIAKVKWNNAPRAKERIFKAFERINKLGESHQIRITQPFLDLKLNELALTYEYEVKKNDEKEEQRRVKEQMREEEKAQKEFERAQKEAEDEEKRFQRSLEKARNELAGASQEKMQALNAKILELEKSLKEAHERKERAMSLAQMTKVGHIYVISNIGSFGDDVYKIGMTRRLDPMDRVKELGDASVPFQFDVHAIIYSENAPQLENELHKQFNTQRVNMVNNKKEFFKVPLSAIEEYVKKCTKDEIEFTKLAEAQEFRESRSILEKRDQKITTQEQEATSKFPANLLG
jgi:hypothetical protein